MTSFAWNPWLAKDLWLAGFACILPGLCPCLHSFYSHRRLCSVLVRGTLDIVLTARFIFYHPKKGKTRKTS